MTDLKEITLKATSATIGLSDFLLVDVKAKYGPNLRFSVTMLIDFAEGDPWAISLPGLRLMKRMDGTFVIQPPLRYSTTHLTIYCAMLSTGLLAAAMDELTKAGWREKVGRNNPVERLLELPVDLSTCELPKTMDGL